MTLRLVSEARPIPCDRLSEDEKDQLKDADAWLAAVRDNAAQERAARGGINRNRGGRVLFIDGVRGSGKTSLMLTLLAGWNREEPEKDYVRKSGLLTSEVRVLLPILEFDPLPRGMPLHGWLLEPWRKEAETIESTLPSRGGIDLSEQWVDVFERVVIGWARTSVEGKGVIEKAIEYQEKAAGWVDTADAWHNFVNDAVCRRAACRKENCKGNHRFVFAVAIDDVDLQVEEIPQLLHAIRLLHHPNVVYVLTGNYRHLAFALELDYRHRHTRDLRTPAFGKDDDGQLWSDIRTHSRMLSNAFLEKSLPQHARLYLAPFDFQHVLDLKLSDPTTENEVHRLGDELGEFWKNIAERTSGLPIAPVRRVQHAIDRHMKDDAAHVKRLVSKEEHLLFMADLCDTEVLRQDGKPLAKDETSPAPYQFVLRGLMTTLLGEKLRVWNGDGLEIVLTERPAFAFTPDGERVGDITPEATNRALLVLLAVEEQARVKKAESIGARKPVEELRIEARGLRWSPEAGVIATQADWRPGSADARQRALFHWPWLARASVGYTLKLGELSKRMETRAVANEANTDSIRYLSRAMLEEWLLEHVSWRLEVPLNDGSMPIEPSGECTTFATRLKDLRLKNNDEIKRDVNLWARDLYVMTSPYFGLPTELAKWLRTSIHECVDAAELAPERLSEAQREVVGNAIIGFGGFEQQSKRIVFKENEFEELITSFLRQRKERLSDMTLWIEDLGPAKVRGEKPNGLVGADQ